MKNIPNHVAIIMDGNGRWATFRGKKRSEGHLIGSKNLETLVPYIFEKGVKILSVYAFSTENFKREKEEVNYLMNLFIKVLKRKFEFLKKQKVKIIFSKKETGLPLELEKLISEVEEETKNNNDFIFNICLNYGGQDELIDMVKKISQKVLNEEIKVSDIDTNVLQKNLYQDLPPVDLLIRTGGEYRISNFMMYQIAYAEMYFTTTLFPDFDENEFDLALEEYKNRDRRFGNIKTKE